MNPWTWVQIALFVISAYISYANRPKYTQPDPGGLADIDFPQAEEGTPQAVFFGDCWSGDWMVLGVGNYRTSPIKAEDGK